MDLFPVDLVSKYRIVSIVFALLSLTSTRKVKTYKSISVGLDDCKWGDSSEQEGERVEEIVDIFLDMQGLSRGVPAYASDQVDECTVEIVDIFLLMVGLVGEV